MSRHQGLLLSLGRSGLHIVPGTLHGLFNKKRKEKLGCRRGFEGRPCSSESLLHRTVRTCPGERCSREIGLPRVGTSQGHITCLGVSPTFQQVYTGGGLGFHCTAGSNVTTVFSGRVLMCWRTDSPHTLGINCSGSPYLPQLLPRNQLRS